MWGFERDFEKPEPPRLNERFIDDTINWYMTYVPMECRVKAVSAMRMITDPIIQMPRQDAGSRILQEFSKFVLALRKDARNMGFELPGPDAVDGEMPPPGIFTNEELSRSRYGRRRQAILAAEEPEDRKKEPKSVVKVYKS